jgi:hypothetical protein
MGKARGRPKKGSLVDMSTAPPGDPLGYELPDPDECEEHPGGRIVLASGHELFARFTLWKDRLIVEFCVGQVIRQEDTWVAVARIDTCHGSVHKHQLFRKRPNDHLGQQHELARIPESNAWSFIDNWYLQALDHMQRHWTENLRRWRHGSP